MYDHAWTSQDTTISHIKEMIMLFNSETNELRKTNQNMKYCIDSCKKEYEEYSEQNTAHLLSVEKITVNGDTQCSWGRNLQQK